MSSVKYTQIVAFKNEAGKNGAGQSPGWGLSGSEEALGAGDAFPFLSINRNKKINSEVPNAIDTMAFQDVPVKMSEYIESSFSRYEYFSGLGRQHYWTFGFGLPTIAVCVFRITAPTVEPVAGATYRDSATNDYTFMRKESYTSSGATVTQYIFRTDDTAVPAGATGNLTKQTGTGDATLAFTAHSVQMYEHVYELDSSSRHFIAYPTAEQVTGYQASDKKNRMATIGIKMSTSDFLFKNAMCKSFKINSSAAGFVEVASDFVAHTQDRGSYNSGTWTAPSDFSDSSNIVTHQHLNFQIGTSESALVDLGVTNWDLGIDIPLQVIQDTASGLYIAEPVLEGMYGITSNWTLSRFSAETYMGYRDAWTEVVARVSANNGYQMQEYLINSSIISDAGPDDSEVTQEQIVLAPSYDLTNNWSGKLYGSTLIHKSPIVYRVRDTVSTNFMFAV
jgi:hypothetical protein